jgi:hypothetical protein
MRKAFIRSVVIAALGVSAVPALAGGYPWRGPHFYYDRVYLGPSMPFGYPGWSYGASIEQTPRAVRVRSASCKVRVWRGVRRCY